ncbi:MAG: hypothetical protein CMJ40_11135 [Phycisphaerae bacterium]|nr:hypothetical protein [Phycisphaerae bacterium]
MRTVLSLILSVFAIQGTVLAAELLVPSEYPSIQAAVNAASNGDDIIVEAGSYWENINTNGTSVNIIGQSNSTSPGDPGTIIYGDFFGPVITVDADCSLSNLIIRNGYANRGGGLKVNANGTAVDVEMDTCWIEECYGSQGGGIYFDGGQTGGTLEMTNCRISRCVSEDAPSSYDEGGGIAFYNGTLSMTNCVLDRNRAADQGTNQFGYGGGLYTQNSLVSVDGCTFTRNTGFAWYIENDCTAFLNNSQFGCNEPQSPIFGSYSGKNNDFDYSCPVYVAQDGSGDYFYIQDAIDFESSGVEIIISGDVYYENLYIPSDRQDLTFVGSMNANGTYTTLAGGWWYDPLVRSEASVSFSDMTFDGIYQGSVYSDGAAFKDESDGLNANATDVSFTNCQFRNNRASNGGSGADGGAILKNGGSLTIVDCSFTNNQADNGFQTRGGAICMNANGSAGGTFTMSGTVLEGNNAGYIDSEGNEQFGSGGAIWLDESITAIIDTSTFSCNRPDDINDDAVWSGSGNEFPTCVLIVARDGSGDYWYLQDAIDEAGDGYIIEVSANTYYPVYIYGKDITIEGTIDAVNGNRTTINAQWYNQPTIECDSSVTLRNLSLVNGESDSWPRYSGGGFNDISSGDNINGTDVVMENVWIENCEAYQNGGGIYKNGGSLSLIDCRLVNNNATWGNGGGLYNQNATVTIENTEIKLNGGGGWYNGDGSVSTLANSTITCNRPYQVNTNGTGVLTDLGGNDVGACVYTVCADGGCDFTTIQDAIDYAEDGEIIEVWPGTYRADPWDDLETPVVDMMGKAIMLRSRDGAEVTIIHGDDERRGILCNSNENASTIIQGFTIRDCRTNYFDPIHGTVLPESGAGLRCSSSSPTIESCIFTENVNEGHYFDGGYYYDMPDPFRSGGGMAIMNGNASVNQCQFIANIAYDSGGGAFNLNSSSQYSNCVFKGCSSFNQGAALSFSQCNSVLSGTEFSTNGTQYVSGAVYGDMSDLYFENCIFSSNEGTGFTGSYFTFSDFVNCDFSRNEGCGIGNSVSSSYVQDSTFCENGWNGLDDICGAWVDFGGNEFLDTCLPPFTCSGDTNLDYNVDVLDILYILATWGTSNPAGDIDGNGLVDVNDVLTVVGNWGPCDD